MAFVANILQDGAPNTNYLHIDGTTFPDPTIMRKGETVVYKDEIYYIDEVFYNPQTKIRVAVGVLS